MNKEAPSRVVETEYGTIRWYGIVRVDSISLAANTPFTFKSSDAGPESLGSIFTAGEMIPADGNPYPGQSPADGWQRPHVWPDGSGEAQYITGPNGVSFICLSKTRGHDTIVDPDVRHVNGTFNVPFDWGYVVISGTVADGDEQGAAGDYFAPGNLDREVSGMADLLLVR